MELYGNAEFCVLAQLEKKRLSSWHSNAKPKEAQESKEAHKSGARQDNCDSRGAVRLVVATLSLQARAGLPPHARRTLATVRWQDLEYWHSRKK